MNGPNHHCRLTFFKGGSNRCRIIANPDLVTPVSAVGHPINIHPMQKNDLGDLHGVTQPLDTVGKLARVSRLVSCTPW